MIKFTEGDKGIENFEIMYSHIRHNIFCETKKQCTVTRSCIFREAYSHTIFPRDSGLVRATVANIKKKRRILRNSVPGEEIDSIFALIHVTRARIHPRAGLQAANATTRDRLPRT